MLSIVLHGSALAIFLIAALIWPRYKQNILHDDLKINIITGGCVFLSAKPLVMVIDHYLGFHLFVLPFESNILRFIFCFVVIDFLRYCLHFIHHRVPFFWQFHAVHHSSEVMDATSGLRMHVFDFLQLSMIPILLFGVLIDTQDFANWVLPAALGIGVFFDAFQHSNLRFDHTKGWRKIWHLCLNNPHFHVWHHIRHGDERDGNYGNTLLIWDRLFGTEVTEDKTPELLGLKSFKALENDPISLQLLKKRT